MAYKTVLTVVTDQELASGQVTKAANLARAHDAHLDVLCLGVDRSQTGYYYAGANAIILQETIERATADAESAKSTASDALQSGDLRWATDMAVSHMADVGRHVSARARFADVVLLPRPYGDDAGAELEAVVEGALFEGGAPVMICPNDDVPGPAPQKVMIGWDESAEALRAVKEAMPLLIAAESVHVVVVDPPAHGPNRSDPGGMLSQFLARHGVRVEIDVLSKTMPRISDVLLRHATDMGANMIVMGAYGHSRFREAILGGATRDMLERCPLPMFMAH